MSERLDRPSDIEFAQAIVQNIPDGSGKNLTLHLGAIYLLGKAVDRAKRR